MSDLFWLTDARTARLQPYFPKSHGTPRVDDRPVLSGIDFINRNGLRWSDAPREFGPPKTLSTRCRTLEIQHHVIELQIFEDGAVIARHPEGKNQRLIDPSHRKAPPTLIGLGLAKLLT
jgi:transposase